MPAIIAMMPIFRPINFPSTFDHHIGRSRESALQPCQHLHKRGHHVAETMTFCGRLCG